MAKEQATNTKAKSAKSSRIPKDVYETIPYRGVYQNGIIEDYEGHFSRMYRIPEINFDVEEEEKQESLVLKYEKLLNGIDDNMIGQLFVINRNIDPDEIRNNILLKPQNDQYNNLRGEFNAFFSSILAEGHNNMVKEKYWVMSTSAENIVDANDILKRVDRKVTNSLRGVCRQDIRAATIKERLHLFYDIYNCRSQLQFDKKASEFLDDNGDLDLKKMAKAGVHSKSLISPDYFHFKPNRSNTYFQLSDHLFAQVGFVEHLPTSLSTSIINDITNLPCNMIASVTYTQMAQAEAAKKIKDKLGSINNQINKQQMDAAREGITNSGATSAELENARDATKELIMDIARRDQRIFKTTLTCVVFAESPEELRMQFANLKDIVASHLCQLRTLGDRQELAFQMALPLAKDTLPLHRILTTESACAFWPFSVTDLNQKDGLVYGINPESQNMIRYNRKTGKNYNAIVLGESGSGKSYIIKEELLQKFLKTDEKIMIIDPQGEYVGAVHEIGGAVVTVSQNSHQHMNPLDMDIQYGGSGENPLPVKCAEIEALVGVMLGSEQLLGPIESNIIHKVGTNLYKGYYEHLQNLQKQGKTVTCDRAAMPTLRDFYEDMANINDPAAQLLAQAIENYCIGSYAIFSARTNVDIDAQVICYDVSDLKGTLKELGMHVCMTNAMNTMISNGRKGKWSNLYIDEAHMFTKTKTAAAALQNLYKTIRKFKGAPTIITQNINDLLINEEAQALLENSSFIVMMNQSPTDRAILADMYGISSKLLEYITDQSYGHGLIYTGQLMVPFENAFPQDTRLNQIMMSQKPDAEE